MYFSAGQSHFIKYSGELAYCLSLDVAYCFQNQDYNNHVWNLEIPRLSTWFNLLPWKEHWKASMHIVAGRGMCTHGGHFVRTCQSLTKLRVFFSFFILPRGIFWWISVSTTTHSSRRNCGVCTGLHICSLLVRIVGNVDRHAPTSVDFDPSRC